MNPRTSHKEASASSGKLTVMPASSTSGRSASAEDKATKAVSCAPAAIEASTGEADGGRGEVVPSEPTIPSASPASGESAGSFAWSSKLDDTPEDAPSCESSIGASAASSRRADAAGSETTGMDVRTSGETDVTLAGALIRSSFAQASRAPAAMAVQPSRMVTSTAPAGTRSSVAPAAS